MVPNELLAHVATVGWEHFALTGDYVWSGEPTRTVDHAFWVRAILCSAVAQQRHKIIRKRVALLGDESVSVVTSAWADTTRRPTYAHLHH